MKNSSEWQALETHFELTKNKKLGSLFAEDLDRGLRLALEACGIYLDFSKNHINQTSLSLLSSYLDSKQLQEKRRALFMGEKINISENRAALHTAARDLDNEFKIDSKKHQAIHASREKMLKLAEALNTGKLCNEKGEAFKHLVCFGIGGSYLGPKLVIKALENFNQSNIDIHFVASIDDFALNKVLKQINLQTTLFVIQSKTFTTIETLVNAEQVKAVLQKIGIKQPEKHFIAITNDIKKALQFTGNENYTLAIEEEIGGRFSLWSAIGFPVAVAIGRENFLALLKGAHKLDKHFFEAENQKNLPVMLALIAFWYQNFFKANTRAIIPYSHALKLLPAFLQQLEMESLGKSVSPAGEINELETGAIIWGSEGPNSQHSFHQLLMQGKHTIPCDFIAINSADNSEKQKLLLTQCIAQSQALAFGNQSENTQKQVKGNQASNTLLLEELKPETLGALLALYEHKVFVQSLLLNVNAFDQWGVGLGKELTSKLQNQANTSEKLDSSTEQLLKKISKD